MPSPFPGMNPYLEQEGVFQDFHQSFIPAARGLLTRQVSPRYVGKVCVEWPRAVDVGPRSYLEIRNGASNVLVTVVELLSPPIKALGADREQYLSRRWRLLRSGVQLVEIDLLRGGLAVGPDGPPVHDYRVLISPVARSLDVCVWSLRLRDCLPIIPIPLRAPDADVALDLQQVLHSVYDDAGYKNYVYRQTAHPPLHPADAAWAQQFLPPGETGIENDSPGA